LNVTVFPDNPEDPTDAGAFATTSVCDDAVVEISSSSERQPDMSNRILEIRQIDFFIL
jgi:hypothetical protein